MSVCRLSNDGLWLHPPIQPDGALNDELDRLGLVRYVVSPNKLHHLFVGDYLSAYREARIYASPGLFSERPDLNFYGVPSDTPEPGWAQDLDQTVFRGNWQLLEVVFFHRHSRTLILTDLLQSAHPDSPLFYRLVQRLYGNYERPGVPPPIRLGFRDKAIARASLERVLSWDFERVVIAHGRVVETGGKAVIRDARSFLL